MPGPGLRVEALGVAGAPAPNRLTTTFRLTGGLLLDTGAACHGVPVADRNGTDTVLLSHSHLDHTLGIPFLLAESELQIRGLQKTLDAVRENLLDGRIWPDLSDRATWEELREGDSFAVGPWQVDVGPANHTVPCVSYLCTSDRGSIAIVGDTRLDDDVIAWVAKHDPSACVVEVSFPDRLAAMARRFGHQTPAAMRRWRGALGADCQLYVTHVKPAYEEEIREQCEALQDGSLHLLHDGDVIFP